MASKGTSVPGSKVTFSTTALSLVVPAMGFRGSAEISWMGSVMRLTGDSKELH